TTLTPYFFPYSSTGSPSYFTDSCFKTPSASLWPLLLARTQAWRVILKPSGSLKTTTGWRWPITKNLQPSSGGDGQAWPWKRPTLFQREIPSDVLILTLEGVSGSRFPSWFPGTTWTFGMISTDRKSTRLNSSHVSSSYA